MRVLQIGADRSKRGILYPESDGYKRQSAYAAQFGNLDIIGFSRASDGASESKTEHLHIIPTNSSSPLMYVFDAVRIAKTLPKPDVVSAQDPFEAGLAAWYIADKLKVPLHIQIHTDFLAPQFRTLSMINDIRVQIARFVVPRASGVRVVSQWVNNSLTARYHLSAHVSVLPIFIDVARFKNAVVPTEMNTRFSRFSKRVLVVSRLEREKNVELAIKAFALAAPTDACLIIVGDGSQRAMLEAQAQAHLAGRVFFEGEQDPAPYYKVANLLLAPSFFEGYGMVVVEALAAGIPVLSTDIGIARESGAIITSHADFAHSIEKWFKDGPFEGTLQHYPYESFDQYVKAYCDDIASTLTGNVK